MSEAHHRRSLSSSSSSSSPRHKQSDPPSPTLTYHTRFFPELPTSNLVEAVAGAAHYSGACVDPEPLTHRRKHSQDVSQSHTELHCEHARVLEDLKDLYCCRPSAEIFQRSWNTDAVFEDPLVKCSGYAEYAPQWFAMPKLFSRSETMSTRIMSSTHMPNRLVYEQTQEYTIRFLGWKKRINSIIIVDLDSDEKIIKLTDQWDGKGLPARFGASWLRVLNAKVTPWLVRAPRLS